MLDDIKGLFSGSSEGKASGQWVNGKWVPNDQMQPQDAQMSQSYQQPMQEQYQQPMQGPYQQPMQGQYQQPMQGPYQQPMQGQYQQPMQGQYQQPMQGQYQQPMQGQYQQPMQGQYQQPMQGQYQQPMQGQYQPPMQGQYQQPMQQPQQTTSAGKWVNGKWVPNGAQEQDQGGLMCPKCKSHNVNVQLIEVGSTTKTKKSGVGLGGHAHNAMRGVAAVGTLGMSNLVIKKATGTEKSTGKTKNKPFCVCQNCGNTWKA